MARPAAKRADIEDAAVHFFATRGLAGTTIRDIAERAGVTDGALYRHYSGKNEMARRLFAREVERFSTELAGVLFDEAASFEGRVRNAVRFIYRYYKKHPMRFSFVLLTQHGFPAEKILEDSYNPNDMVIRFVSTGMAAGNIEQGDPVFTAALLMGAVLQPVVMHRYGRVKRQPLEGADEVAGACLRMLGRADR
ncbi:MAG: TetR/AcrR family transcriptional regulator [Planctomycetota bacterium]|jgi:AcrR family transcriptional regulator